MALDFAKKSMRILLISIFFLSAHLSFAGESIEIMKPEDVYYQQILLAAAGYETGLESLMKACCSMATPFKALYLGLCYPGYMPHLENRCLELGQIKELICNKKADPGTIHQSILKIQEADQDEKCGVLRTLFLDQIKSAYNVYLMAKKFMNELESKQNAFDSQLCSICFSNPKNMFFKECGHCACQQCIEKIKETSYQYKCHICREISQEVQHLF